MCVVFVYLISSRLEQGVQGVTGLLNISGLTVDVMGRETPTAHVINVATQCSCSVCEPVCFSLNQREFVCEWVCVAGCLFSWCRGRMRSCFGDRAFLLREVKTAR